MTGCSDFESRHITGETHTSTITVLLWKSRGHDFIDGETPQLCGEHSRVRVIVHAYSREGEALLPKEAFAQLNTTLYSPGSYERRLDRRCCEDPSPHVNSDSVRWGRISGTAEGGAARVDCCTQRWIYSWLVCEAEQTNG